MTDATPEASPPAVDDALLADIEALAVELAREAGGTATEALERVLEVEYKTEAKGKQPPRDPVSEVDRAVEALVRERVAERFPTHAIIGEEVDDHPAPGHEFVWVVDPVDGTANFINGFPLFAVSIGVLHRGTPVVGAVWCGTSHALRPGVYHAHVGGPLHFDGVAIEVERASEGVRRRLSAAAGGSPAGTREWDHRVTGCAAIEIAFVAAGIFQSATLWGLHLWDVAGGVTLVRAAGREVWLRGRNGWQPLERFEAPDRLPRNVKEERAPSLRDWRQPLIVGTPEATRLIRERARAPSWWRRSVARIGLGRRRR